jgi:hypothetical protein
MLMILTPALCSSFYREERCYVPGRLDGPAKYFYTSGAVETRIYENGVLQGIHAEVVTFVAGSLEAGGLPGSLEITEVLK